MPWLLLRLCLSTTTNGRRQKISGITCYFRLYIMFSRLSKVGAGGKLRTKLKTCRTVLRRSMSSDCETSNLKLWTMILFIYFNLLIFLNSNDLLAIFPEALV